MARATATAKGTAGQAPKWSQDAPATKRPRRHSGEAAARKAIVSAGLKLQASGLTPGRSGNLSIRFGDGMLITPSGIPYDEINPADIVFVAADGSVPAGQRKPSSEWRFHLAALEARPDRHAVVHTHSLNATILACRHEPIPAFHYMVAIAGGSDIPCVPYAPFGSDELAGYVAEGLAQRDACLMANHGMIVIGRDMAHALEILREVEQLAEQYVRVLALGGPKTLSDAQMDEVQERFKSYGQNAQPR